MTLKSADHVALIIRLLSKDGWLADAAWPAVMNTRCIEIVPLPDRVSYTNGGFMTIEQGRSEYRETEELEWPDRAAWEADRSGGKQMRAPFSKAQFKRKSRKKVAQGIQRTFSTSVLGIGATTIEHDGKIVEVVFRGCFTFGPNSDRQQEVARFGPNDISAAESTEPAAQSPTILSYDKVSLADLEAAILEMSAYAAMDDLDCATPDEVKQEFDVWDLKTAVHTGALLDEKVAEDLDKVSFDLENTMIDFQATGISGLNQIGDFSFLGCAAGGDWEFPVIAILYMRDGIVRGFIPDNGNHYNRDTMAALGNGDAGEAELASTTNKDWNSSDLRSSICAAFGLN